MAGAGDFEAFVRARYDRLLRFAYLLTADPHLAADLVQEALERCGLAWRRVERVEEPDSYVRRAIVNAHVSLWRRRRRERLMPDVPDQSRATPPREPDGEAAAIWAALGALPRGQRAVLVLRYYEDLSEIEIARVLGCAPGTVKSQAAKGLARLRTVLNDRESTWTG